MQFLLAYWRLNSIRVCDYLGVIKSNKIVFNALFSIHVFGFISVNITIVIALQTFLSKVEKFFFCQLPISTLENAIFRLQRQGNNFSRERKSEREYLA